MLEFTQRYSKKPSLFVREVLGVKPLDYQAEFLDAIASGERKISIGLGMALVSLRPLPGRCFGTS